MHTAIKRVAAIGVGTQGSAMAFGCAVHGIEVNLYMRTAEKCVRARDALAAQIEDPAISELSSTAAEEAIGRLHVTPDLEQALANVDLAFESVYEDLEYKKHVHAEVGRRAPDRVMMGSNMSSLLCSPLAEASGRPERFFCMNWGDPRYKQWVNLVMWNAETSESTKKAALEWAKTCNMVAVIAKKDTFGYGFNKVWRDVKKACLKLWADGVIEPDDMDRLWMLGYGSRLGPFAMMDEIGLDTVKLVEMSYFQATEDEDDRPPQKFCDLVDSGRLGKKSGRGFYSYPDPPYESEDWLYKRPPYDS